MKLIRFIDDGGVTRFGEPVDAGQARVLSGDFASGWQPTGQTEPIASLLPPVDPPNIFCIGKNYHAHAAEFGGEVDKYPSVFMKPTTALRAAGEAIEIPACEMNGPETDYEAELALVIGKTARDVSEDDALDHVFGYACANDVSARRWQKQGGGGQWCKGKGFDTFCPIGPAVVTADEIDAIGGPQGLSVKSILNGDVMQDANTWDMVFEVAELVSFLSRGVTLLPGTLILTGTPEGVGFARKPPIFMKDGDEIAVEISGLGRLENRVVALEG